MSAYLINKHNCFIKYNGNFRNFFINASVTLRLLFLCTVFHLDSRLIIAQTILNPTVEIEPNLIIPPPATPKDFTATVFSANQINLKWSDVFLESSYTIQYTTNNPYLPTNGIILIAHINIPANITTFESKNLKPGTTYYYRIKATGGSGSSAYSAWVKATTFIFIPPPATPTNFRATVFSTNQINLKWSDVFFETSYTIQYTTNNPYLPTNGINLMTQLNIPANVTTFESKNLKPGTTYYYRIKATGGSGGSAYSTWTKATTFIPIVARNSNHQGQREKMSISQPFFPNPVQDEITVDLSMYKDISVTIFIYDLTGRLHRSFSATAAHLLKLQINVSYLVSGAYVLKLQTATTFKSYKLIKE